MKFKSNSSGQSFLLPPSLDEFVPQDSLARVVLEVVDYLDLKSLYLKYSSDGCPAYHPKIMLRILFYAYSNGIQSSRMIAQRLRQDTHFMYLSGMQIPDFRTISDFRKDNLDLIKGYFKQIVLYCIELDMVSVGHISIDGTKIKAAASKKQTKDMASIEKELKKLEQEISDILTKAEKIDQDEDKEYGKTKSGDELPEEIQDKINRKNRLEQAKEILAQRGSNKINLTDLDSNFMETSSGKELSYNAQAAADSDNQVIIANDVVTDRNDYHQFIPMYEQTVENVYRAPGEVSTDCGYATHKSYQYMLDNKIDAYVPLNLKTLEPYSTEAGYTKDKFDYDPERDLFICPEGRTLPYFQTKTNKGNLVRAYRCSDCSDCHAIESCLHKNNKSKKRIIHRYRTDDYVAEMQQKLRSDQGRQIYKKRKITVEPVFGNIKHNLGLNQFFLRGLGKVHGEFNIMCIAHNLRKITAYKMKGTAEIRLEIPSLFAYFKEQIILPFFYIKNIFKLNSKLSCFHPIF